MLKMTINRKIQDYSAGHKVNAQGAHFKVRPPEDLQNGVVDGCKTYYELCCPTCFDKGETSVDAIKIMHQINEVCQKHGMLKVWISDQYNYIAYNDIGIVYMKLDFNLHGNIWSDDEQFTIELSNSIKNIGEDDAS